jgi:hypothetical protein
MVSKLLQYHKEIFFIFSFALGLNKYIIDEQYDKLVQIFHKYLVH